MIIYVLSFLLILFFVVNEQAKTPIFYKNGLAILFFFLSLIVGGRDMIGGYDVYVYGEFFDNLSINNFPLLFEPGYTLYNFIIRQVTQNRYLFFLITAFLTYFLFYKSIKKNSAFIFFSLFLFYCKFFLMSFVYVRQAIAMGIVWVSIPYLSNRGRVYPVLLVFLAMCFHITAAVFFIAVLFASKKLHKKTVVFVFFVCLLFGLSPAVKNTLSYIGEYFYIAKASGYALGEISSINYFYLFESAVIGGIIILFYDELYKKDALTRCLANISVIYVSLSFFSLREPTFNRVIWYFLIGIICTIPYLCNIIYKKRGYYYFITVLYFSLLFFRMLLVWDSGDFIPYKAFFIDTERSSIWSGNEYDNRYLKDKFYK